jgi:hypothetical protein
VRERRFAVEFRCAVDHALAQVGELVTELAQISGEPERIGA